MAEKGGGGAVGFRFDPVTEYVCYISMYVL